MRRGIGRPTLIGLMLCAAALGTHFSLRADRNVAPYDYWLEQKGATFGKVSVASAYPSLVLRPRRH